MTELVVAIAPPQGLIIRAFEPPALPDLRSTRDAPRIAAVVGAPGRDGAVPTQHDVLSPSASWIIAHGLGRRPIVTVHLPSGELVLADVVADATHVTVTLPTPMTGFVLIA